MGALRSILVAFDLDDTLYKECDYVCSGYIYVARRLSDRLGVPRGRLEELVLSGDDRRHPFDRIYDEFNHVVSVDEMVGMYRDHMPDLSLPDESRRCLDALKEAGVTLALITDGRHRGQWNKIRALGLQRYFEDDLISVSADIGADKNEPFPWIRMENLTPWCRSRWYVGDNPRKDFYHPRARGWNTVMLQDDGTNVRSQNVVLPAGYMAGLTIGSLSELSHLIFSEQVLQLMPGSNV